MNVEQLQERRESLTTERAFVEEARGADERRLGEIDEQIALVDAQLADLADVDALYPEAPAVDDTVIEEDPVQEPNAPETAEAPAAPEQAVAPAPKRGRKKAE